MATIIQAKDGFAQSMQSTMSVFNAIQGMKQRKASAAMAQNRELRAMAEAERQASAERRAINAANRAQAEHDDKMKKNVVDYDIAKENLQQERFQTAANVRQQSLAKRDNSMKNLEDQITQARNLQASATLTRKRISETHQPGTAYTKEEMLDLKEAQSLMQLANNMETNSQAGKLKITNPGMSEAQIAKFVQTSLNAKNMNTLRKPVVPMSAFQQNYVKDLRDRVRPGKMPEFSKLLEQGNYNNLVAFGSDETTNVFNKAALNTSIAVLRALEDPDFEDKLNEETRLRLKTTSLSILTGEPFEVGEEKGFFGRTSPTIEQKEKPLSQAETIRKARPSRGAKVDAVSGAERKTPALSITRKALDKDTPTLSIEGFKDTSTEDLMKRALELSGR